MGAEKALLKKAAVDEAAEAVRRHADGRKNYLEITKGGVAAIEACIQQLQGVHRKLEAALEAEKDEERITEDQYKVAKRYMTLELGLLQNMHSTMKAQLPAIKHEIEGLYKSVNILDSLSAGHQRAAEKFEREEAEEDEYRKDLQERQEEPPEEAAQEEPPEEEEAPKNEEPNAEDSEPAETQGEQAPSCFHCHEPVILKTGGGLCAACKSYENRYSKLPPEHVLEARQKKKEHEDADS